MSEHVILDIGTIPFLTHVPIPVREWTDVGVDGEWTDSHGYIWPVDHIKVNYNRNTGWAAEIMVEGGSELFDGDDRYQSLCDGRGGTLKLAIEDALFAIPEGTVEWGTP